MKKSENKEELSEEEKRLYWLKERLKLEVSEEKTKIVNLKTEYSEFLGFKLKVYKNYLFCQE